MCCGVVTRKRVEREREVKRKRRKDATNVGLKGIVHSHDVRTADKGKDVTFCKDMIDLFVVWKVRKESTIKQERKKERKKERQT